ncbi:hypothetical protein Ait01nite_020860 [Actinoplanes italicus]|uniref:Uncharacterized protein n=1 Tax=Actinoplanes italicus TaxID=113567 RepID=A0A2T0KP55_9ACTN|nr:hypothetical protein [Actinoplanes italicus]PRX25517.1 hypothetical protein CLV67_101234 [Actinoplanes italicus]GIE29041.1 hypothetical protein Ait01nite_020860 [Actinoplanes italicus]
MSTQEHVYFHSRHSPPEFAAAIAPAIGMAVIRGGRGETFLSRPLPGGGAVGGELRANELAGPGEPSFLDVFPLVLDLGITIGDRGRQLAEARTLFTELARASPVPVALVRGYDFLLGVAEGGKGPVWFPENITPYAEDQQMWLPFQP